MSGFAYLQVKQPDLTLLRNGRLVRGGSRPWLLIVETDRRKIACFARCCRVTVTVSEICCEKELFARGIRTD